MQAALGHGKARPAGNTPLEWLPSRGMRPTSSVFKLFRESTVAVAITLISVAALLFWFFGPGDEEWARRGDAIAPLSVFLAAIASILSANALRLQRTELALQRQELEAGRAVQVLQESAQLRMAKAQEEANQLVRAQLRVQKLAVLASLRGTWSGLEPTTVLSPDSPDRERAQRAEYERIRIEVAKLLEALSREP
jgi:hypothetical protein